jgi:primosomal protein N' (replication factor Y)
VYRFAGIIINSEAVQLDRVFTYKIPDVLTHQIDLGYRVKIPFGRGNRILDGFIVELYNECENIENLKEIIKIADDKPLLKRSDLSLIKNMKEKYLCTYLECIKVMIPKGITKGIKNKTCNVLYLGKELEGKYLKRPYDEIFNLVKSKEGIYTKSELSKKYNLSLSSINTMIKHGFIRIQEIVVHRFNDREYKTYAPKKLTSIQQHTVNSIINSDKKRFLIHGVTGSGKTEIYMQLVNLMMMEKKQSIILVPEISLTPQMVERFKGRFGKDIAVFHSKLSDGERFDEWMRIKEGKVSVAIGARSAVFLPFDNLGMIIIDEEHEGSYKSDSDPKYYAREVAYMKSDLEGCKVVLGSATPSIETYYECMQNNIELITIKNRVDGKDMPQVETVDMREELKNNNRSIFSRKLYEEIHRALSNKEQIILFLNRRGFSPFVSCRKCGYVFKCNNCDISLTYHSRGDYLSCHYCGAKQRMTRVCPKCGSKYVKYFGVGTEKIEQEIRQYFPEARTIRMDFDTTRKKNSYEDIYNNFKNRRADILIGTQMVAKGLDFDNVTLVGVIAADLSLNLPDYRSAERTFQLITQVSGRAGRGEKPGRVIVQTYNPDNFSIISSINNDYKSFYEEEITLRYNMNYPPYAVIMAINLSCENEEVIIKGSQNLGCILRNKIKNYDKISMLGPCPSGISKIKNQFRWQIILKGDLNNKINNEVKETVYNFLKPKYSSIKVGIDVNPNSLV